MGKLYSVLSLLWEFSSVLWYIYSKRKFEMERNIFINVLDCIYRSRQFGTRPLWSQEGAKSNEVTLRNQRALRGCIYRWPGHDRVTWQVRQVRFASSRSLCIYRTYGNPTSVSGMWMRLCCTELELGLFIEGMERWDVNPMYASGAENALRNHVAFLYHD